MTAPELPQDLEAEASTLSACIQWRDAMDWAATVLRPEAFFADPARRVWAVMLELHGAGRPIDPVTIAGALRVRRELEAIGGIESLERLTRAAPDPAHVEAYAGIVLAKAKARDMITAAERIALEARGQVADVDAWASGAVAELAGVAEGGLAASSSKTGLELAGRLFDRWQNPERQERSLRTGISDLDRITRGLRRKQFVVIGAGSGVGKSALALNVATATATRASHDEPPAGVLIFSLEMAADELMERLGCSVARLDSTRLDADFGGRFTDDEGRRLISAIKAIGTKRLEIDDRPGLTPSQVRAKARSVAARMRRDGLELRLVVVDYVQIMGSDRMIRRDTNREQEVAACGRALKNIAKELELVVLGLAQLNQDHAKEKRRPRETDLRESRGLTNDADKVLLIWNEQAAARQAAIANGDALHLDPNAADDVEIIVAKQRRGRPGTILASYWPAFTLFGPKVDATQPDRRLPAEGE